MSSSRPLLEHLPTDMSTQLLNGMDESTWLDVIHKMDEVYSQLIHDEMALEAKNQTLQEQQQFITSVLSSMTDVLVVCDEMGRIEQANAAFCDVVGQPLEQLHTQFLMAYLADETSLHATQEALRWATQPLGQSQMSIEWQLRDATGQAVPVDATCTPRRSGTGRCLGTVWVGRPTGELRRAYVQLQTAHDALKRTQQQLVHSEKMASLGQLVAGVAHELNNPISFVLGNVYALRRYAERMGQYLEAINAHGLAHSPTSGLMALTRMRQQLRIDHLLADLPSLIDGTLEGAQRTADIVQGLKRFSAMDGEQRHLIDLAEVVQRAIHWVEKGAPTTHTVQVTWQHTQSLPVCASEGQMQQVLMNLLQNAFDALIEHPHPHIWVNGNVVDSMVIVTVCDNGSGILPEHLTRVFDPFFTTKPVGKGTGLGLSISYGIVEQHGGQLSVSSAKQGGAAFELRLPKA